jgi:hypothetical protein
MRAPSPPDLLGAWERGLDQGPVERGLTLLALACPDTAADALAALSIGERDRRLLGLRESLFGARMTGLVACPSCGEQLELDVATAELSCAPAERAPIALAGTNYALELRLPDSRDLLACAGADPAQAPAALFHACLVSARIDGTSVAAHDLPPDLIAAAARAVAQADPQADVRFSLTCASCGHHWDAPFDIVPFLWAELDAWAARLLREVHELASAYGWSEPDILALGPARRQLYLRMLGT